jgi:branched-subunit amino acid ABC-type transport system permease component
VAEETGAVVPLGTWVLHEACRQAAEWHAARPDAPPLTIGVNLSARQVAHPAIVQVVESALATSGLDPATLDLEITESVLMEDPEASVRTLERLKGLGVRIVLDDFGTGYSSLAYVRRFPIDVLKVDREFVADLVGENADATIVEAVLSMARGLTLAVSSGQTVYGFPASFTFVGQAELLGVSLLAWLTLATFAIGYLVLSRTVFGHQVYAIGGNREAARLAGIPVRRVSFLVYAIAGLCAGLSAVALTSQLNSALPSAAEGLELQVIAAVVIGGTSLFGGRGNMVGTLVGVLLIGTLNNGLTLLNVAPFWVQFVQGVVIFLAVLIDALNRRR